MPQSLVVLLGLFSFAIAETVTLYGVRGTVTPTSIGLSIAIPEITLSPIGVGSDGATTYDAILRVPSGGSPFPIPATTEHATYIADATHVVISAVADGLEIDSTTTKTYATSVTDVQRCSWGTERVQGTCVLEFNGEPRITLVGTVAPFYTLTVASGNSARPVAHLGRSGLMIAPLLGIGVAIGVARLISLC